MAVDDDNDDANNPQKFNLIRRDIPQQQQPQQQQKESIPFLFW